MYKANTPSHTILASEAVMPNNATRSNLNSIPTKTVTKTSGTKIKEARDNLQPNFMVQKANTGAIKMKRTDALATSGRDTNIPAIRIEKIPTTRMRHAKQKPKNSWRPVKPISFSMMNEIDLPLLRTDITKAAKSWNAPTKTQPTKIQISAGRKPKYAAMIGPTIGPGPAIEAKW